MNIAKDKIEGTQIPTNIPSSFCPLNQRDTDKRKLIKANITG